MAKALKTDRKYAVCDNEHQIIMYKWTPQNFWDCPICSRNGGDLKGNPITHLNVYEASDKVRFGK